MKNNCLTLLPAFILLSAAFPFVEIHAETTAYKPDNKKIYAFDDGEYWLREEISYKYFPDGLLKSEENDDFSTYYVYDEWNRLQSEKSSGDDYERSTTYTYERGKIKSLRIEGSEALDGGKEYYYSDSGVLSKTIEWKSVDSYEVRTETEYVQTDEKNNPLEMRILVEEYEYDYDDEDDKEKISSSTTVVYMTYDEQGNPVTKEEWQVDQAGGKETLSLLSKTVWSYQYYEGETVEECIRLENDVPVEKTVYSGFKQYILKDPFEWKPLAEGTVFSVTSSGCKYRVLEEDSTVSLIGSDKKKVASIQVPDTVTYNEVDYKVAEIAEKAFTNQNKLTKVVIGGNVEKIGKNAFADCKKLKSVKFGKAVTSAEAGAFRGCTKLSSVKLNANLKLIGNKAFYKCASLKKVTIPAKVSQIGKSAFQSCKKLRTVTIKTKKLKAKKVGAKAFKGISSKATIKVPKNVKKAYKKWLRKKGVSKKVKIKG